MFTILLLVTSCFFGINALQPPECGKEFEDFDSDRNLITYDCPGGCDDGAVDVTGGPVDYAAGSVICAAAVHEGAISDITVGGTVVMERGPSTSAPTLTGGVNNGVTAMNVAAPNVGDPFFTFSTAIAEECGRAVEDINRNVFTFDCSATTCVTGDTDDQVWYDSIDTVYATKSLICVAATHAGEITAGTAGTVVVEKQAGILQYDGGASANSVNPQTLSEAYDAFRFSAIPVQCVRTAGDESSATFTYICPAGCDAHKDVNDVVGSDIYSLQTSICIAAIHDGQFDAADGGTVIVNKQGDQAGFTGSTANGITTISAGAGPGFAFNNCFNGTPNPTTSACDCNTDWYGPSCNILCKNGSYNAANTPPCTCDAEYVGPKCNYVC